MANFHIDPRIYILLRIIISSHSLATLALYEQDSKFLTPRTPEKKTGIGLEIARGPEDVAWYIQNGSPW